MEARSVWDLPQWVDVTLLAGVTAIATGLGALPFLVVRNMSKRVQALATAVAGGAMLGASFGLIMEGLSSNGGEAAGVVGDGAWRTILGVALGIAVITASRRLIPSGGGLEVADLRRADARRAVLVIAVMTVHSAAEGIGVGVSFGDTLEFGLFITVAIAIHNIPEGLAISAVMVPNGTPVWKAAWWSVFSSIPQPVLALPAFLFVEAFAWWLPVGLGFAAGAMVWMVIAELLPESYDAASPNEASLAAGAGLTVMLALQTMLQVG
jgi:zinc transporter ZupT